MVVRFSVVVGLLSLFFLRLVMFWWVCGEDLYLLTHYPVSSCYVVSSICKFRLAVCRLVRSFVLSDFSFVEVSGGGCSFSCGCGLIDNFEEPIYACIIGRERRCGVYL